MEPKHVKLPKEEIEKIFGKEPTSPASEEEKAKAYAYLGILATTFAMLESRLMSLIASMEGISLVGFAMIENNSLEKNLQLLETINKMRLLEPEKLKAFIAEVKRIKNHRNNLIHGDWQIFRNEEDKPVIAVRNKKTKIEKVGTEVHFKFNAQSIYTFQGMETILVIAKGLVDQINSLLLAQLIRKNPGSEKLLTEIFHKKEQEIKKHI